MSADLSIIIVNFNSGEYLAGCIESLKAQSLGGLRVEYIVVDCASTMDQKDWLDSAAQQSAQVLALDRNQGYAGGCNHGLARSSGRFVFFLNADVVAVGDCVSPLAAFLMEQPDVGIVEPRTFLDAGCTFFIPEIHELTRWELLTGGVGRLTGGFAQKMSLRRVRRTLPMWQAQNPITLKTLSGAFMGTRREVIEGVGGFDENFSLFYEDSDLFQRIRSAGFRLVLLPRSRAIHFAHRSVATVWDEAMAKHRDSRERYIKKHLGRLTSIGNRLMERAVVRLHRIRTPKPCRDASDLGAPFTPPCLQWTGPEGPYLLELALDPFFNLAAAAFCNGNEFGFTQETWDSLIIGEYYLRALELKGLRERGRWKVTKVQAS
ncbi:MAG: glycosyltransferase family 2 protein [Planctomycetota bacterium]|jgi:GT2 family glycosyltransferase